MNIKKNAIYNIAGALIPLAVILGTIPLYIKIIGAEKFGALTIFWLSIGYFSLLDFGSSKATTFYISKNSNSPNEINRIFWTSWLINLIISILISGFILIATKIFEKTINLDNSNPFIYFIGCKYWIGAAITATMMGNIASSALQAKQKFLLLNTINTTGSLLFQIIPIITIYYFNGNIETAIKSGISTKIFTSICLNFNCFKSIAKFDKITLNKQTAISIFSFGQWIAISNIISTVIVTADRYIITAISGTKNLTYYTIPFQIAEKSTIIPAALSSALLPNIAYSDKKNSNQLIEKAFSLLLIISTPLFLIGVLSVEKILGLWIDINFSQNASMCAKILLIGFFYNGLGYIKTIEIQANGKPKIITKCHLIEIIPYLLCLFVFLKYFNIIGAAIAFLLRAASDLLLLSAASSSLSKTLKSVAIPSALLTITLFSHLFNSNQQLPLYLLVTTIYTFWTIIESKKYHTNKICNRLSKYFQTLTFFK